MPPPEENSRIEELKKSLYSRTAPDVHTRRKLRFFGKDSSVKTSWERQPDEPIGPIALNEEGTPESSNINMSFFTKLLIGSFIFCVIAISLGAFIFFKGGNLISANNIDISISGPVSIPGGEPVSFDIRVNNKNNVDLKVADLSVDFPDGSNDPDNPSRELKTFRELLGDIPAGNSAQKTVKAIIFGEENIQKQIHVTVTYSIKGSSAVFTKTKDYDVLINSSPINVTVSSFKEITSGQEFDFKVNVKSNSKDVLRNVLLKTEYPFGFTYISSDLKPFAGNSSWKIGDIPPGGTRSITIHGKVEGEDNDTRVFRFRVGAQDSKNTQEIGTEYMAITQELAIQKPFISLDLSVNNDDPKTDYVGNFGESMRVEVSWFNNLPSTVSNAEITVKLSGSAYDKTTVQPDLGYYRSATDEIVWNRQSIPELASIGAGETGSVSFTLTPSDRSTASQPVVNPFVSISSKVSGSRTQETKVPETISSATSKQIKISSHIALTGRVVRTVGNILNVGPIPPKVEQKTTYTIMWSVDNTSSAASNGRVTATLPQGVRWENNFYPSGEIINYDPNSGTVTWEVGSMGPYSSSSSRRKEVAFQVSIVPGADLAGQSPILVNQASLTAEDDFTGATLESTQDYLTTRFSTDPSYREGDEKVAR